METTMLVVYDTNILLRAFTSVDLESAENTVTLSALFVLLGSGSIKALHKMLVKSTPDYNKRMITNHHNVISVIQFCDRHSKSLKRNKNTTTWLEFNIDEDTGQEPSRK